VDGEPGLDLPLCGEEDESVRIFNHSGWQTDHSDWQGSQAVWNFSAIMFGLVQALFCGFSTLFLVICH
jgi:hypothetical protein